MEKNHNNVNKFWEGFRESVIKHGIPEKHADWYVKWGHKFALSIKSKPLRKRTVEDIKSFLSNLKKHKNIEDWQVEQARKSLYILYYKYLNIPLKSTEIQKKYDKNEILPDIDYQSLKEDVKKNIIV